MEKRLDWSKITWEGFQILSLQIVENLLPGVVVDQYLDKGMKQDGIDLIQRTQPDDSFLTVQCKKEIKLTTGDIDGIIKEFETGQFVSQSTDFILVTTAPLRGKKLDLKLNKYKKELFANHQVVFIWWDDQFLQDHLQKMYPLVEYYFGRTDAEGFCYKERPNKHLGCDPNEDSIRRTMSPIVPISSVFEAFWYRPDAHKTNLVDLFSSDRVLTQRICLIGEPYHGKSTYMCNCAAQVQNLGRSFTPFFLDVKKISKHSIDDLLEQRWRNWKSIPFKNIVVFIDGLDESPASYFLDLVRQIAAFAVGFPSISIILSCRGVFYHQFQLARELTAFHLYQLVPISTEELDSYLKKRLGERKSVFEHEVERNNMRYWLYHPFYLNKLVEKFLADGALPLSKVEIIDQFIKASYNSAEHRVVGTGERLRRYEGRFSEAVQKLALVMQLSGQNAFSHADFERIFSDQEIDFFRNCSIISGTEDNWTFTNAFFQEHLAARSLLEFELEEIFALVSVGQQIRKISPKWLQTILSLLTLLKRGSDTFNNLLAFIEKDSVELVFQTDPTLHDDEFKISRLGDFWNMLVDDNIWPMICTPEAAAVFLSGVESIADVLLKVICKLETPAHVRRFTARILSFVDAPDASENDILSAVLKLIEVVQTSDEATDLVRILVTRKIGDASSIDLVVEKSKFHGVPEFRNAMYDWITVQNLTKLFWPYGIAGVPILVSANLKSRQIGSERSLEKFLLSFETRAQLYSLFDVMNDPGWIQITSYTHADRFNFLTAVLRRSVDLSKIDPKVILPLIHFLKGAGSHFVHTNTKVIFGILNQVQFYSAFVTALLPDILSEGNWHLGDVVTNDTTDLLLAEIDEFPEKLTILEHALNGVTDAEKKALLRSKVFDITHDDRFAPFNPLYAEKFQATTKRRKAKDRWLIISKERFRRAVFAEFRKKGQNVIDWSELIMRRHFDDFDQLPNFLMNFFRDWISAGSHFVSREECRRFFENDDQFELFRASEILAYLPNNPDETEQLEPILKNWYYDNLPKCTFENAYHFDGYRVIIDPRLELVGKIFRQFEYKTTDKFCVELLWLDIENTPQSRWSMPDKSGTLREKVLKQMDENSIALREGVIKHLKIGISAENVLLSHLTLAEKLHIRQAQPFAFAVLEKETVSSQWLEPVAKIFLTLGGKKERLIKLIDLVKPGDEFWLYLTKELADLAPKKIAEAAIAFIGGPPIRDYGAVRTAYLLASIGYIEGFQYLVDALKETGQSTMILHDGLPFTKLDTTTALKLIEDVMYLVVDPKHNALRPPDSPRTLVMDWLWALGSKSEADLLLVLDFLHQVEAQWLPVFPTAKDLRWIGRRYVERFRNEAKTAYSIAEISQLVKYGALNKGIP